MSRIGKMAVKLPDKVSVSVDGQMLSVKGPKGALTRRFPPEIGFDIGSAEVSVNKRRNDRRSRAMHGLGRALLQNMVTGVSAGFTRSLEVNGVGYRAEVKGNLLQLALGYSHPIEVVLPEGVSAKVDKSRIELSGIDKEQLGQLAATIRGQRGPEPYKGKGVKYVNEQIRRKVGKAGSS